MIMDKTSQASSHLWVVLEGSGVGLRHELSQEAFSRQIAVFQTLTCPGTFSSLDFWEV